MFEVVDIQIVHTSVGAVLVLKDVEGDFQTLQLDSQRNEEAIEKYERRQDV